MSAITTHVLDTSRGRPAPRLPITLAIKRGDDFVAIASGETDDDGRLRTLTSEHPLEVAIYRLTFDTRAYFEAIGVAGFYPEASIVFEVKSVSEHYHVPLLLNPYGYSTYRGS